MDLDTRHGLGHQTTPGQHRRTSVASRCHALVLCVVMWPQLDGEASHHHAPRRCERQVWSARDSAARGGTQGTRQRRTPFTRLQSQRERDKPILEESLVHGIRRQTRRRHRAVAGAWGERRRAVRLPRASIAPGVCRRTNGGRWDSTATQGRCEREGRCAVDASALRIEPRTSRSREAARRAQGQRERTGQRSRHHGTPMHLAARRGHIEIVRVLLQNEADVHIRGDDGRTVLEIAVASGHRNIEKLTTVGKWRQRLIGRWSMYGITWPSTQGPIYYKGRTRIM